MKVKPSLGVAIGVLFGYLAVVFASWIITDVDYDTIADSVENVRNAVTISMAVGFVYLVIVVSALGWWKPAMREPRRVGSKWMWIIPAVLLIGAIANLATTEWGRIDELGTKLGPYVAWLAIGCLLVGFNEEMLTRGQLIVGARGNLHEVGVWFTSALAFGLIHVPNIAFGQSVGTTLQQVVLAFTIGTAYYVIRRISGLLVVTMLLHGLWDFSVFIQDHSVDGMDDPTVAGGGPVMFIAGGLGLLAVWRLLREKQNVVEPGGDQLAAFQTTN